MDPPHDRGLFLSGHPGEDHSGHIHAEYEAAPRSLDARAKIFVFFSTVIIGVSTPVTSPRAFAVYFAAIALMAVALKVSPSDFFKRVVVILPFVLFIAASTPFAAREAGEAARPLFNGAIIVSDRGLAAFANAAVKGALGVSALTALSLSTPFNEMLAGFRWFKTPAILVSLAAFSYRYMFVLVDEASRMKRARDSRGWRGRWLWQAGVVGNMVGALLLRSFERSERVYAAMLSRGYDGSLPMAELPSPRPVDFAIPVFFFAAIISARLFL